MHDAQPSTSPHTNNPVAKPTQQQHFTHAAAPTGQPTTQQVPQTPSGTFDMDRTPPPHTPTHTTTNTRVAHAPSSSAASVDFRAGPVGRACHPSQAESTVHAALGSLAAQVGAMRQHLPHVEGLQQCVCAAEDALLEAKQVRRIGGVRALIGWRYLPLPVVLGFALVPPVPLHSQHSMQTSVLHTPVCFHTYACVLPYTRLCFPGTEAACGGDAAAGGVLVG